MKVVSYTALHYGKDYLFWAIRSVIDYVDEHHILYAPVGSHGHRTQRSCPDTRAELYAEAERAAGTKLRWHEGLWAYEGEQRNSIHAYAPAADVILVVDADEVWSPDTAAAVIDFMSSGYRRLLRIRMIHYWRSFYRAVVRDPAYPIRVICPKVDKGEETFVYGKVASPESALANPRNSYWINHFGYAQRSELVEYKQHTHGHRSEWRKDDWFNTVFMANAQTNCHPVGSEYWNPEPVNPLDYMPEWMSEHPYFNQEIIP